MWIYPTTASQNGGLFDKRSSGSNYSQFPQVTLESGVLKIYVSYTGSSWAAEITGATPTPNSWTHIALVRYGNTWTLYVNGVVSGTPVTASGSVYASTDSLCIGASATNGHNPFTGYISNVRIVKGTAVYTSAFTPSITPLTAITNTVLLTCQDNTFKDNSTANSSSGFTISTTSTPSLKPFSPFAPNSVYSTANTGGSLRFDGSGDYLDITDYANVMDLGGRAAHLEFWYYPTATGTQVVISKGGGSADWGSSGFEYQVQYVSGSFNFYWNAAGTPTAISLAKPINSWYHLVVATDSSNNIAFFINGVRAGTGSNAITKPSTRTLFRGGSDVSSNWTNGIISGLRFVSGNNAYSPLSSSISVPTIPPRNDANTVLLINGTSGAIIDSTGKNIIETVADAKANNSLGKFLGSSIYLDGTGDYLTIKEDPIFRFGGGDFTIEGWIYPTSIGGSGYYTLAWHNNGSSSSDVTGTTQINPNVWTHIAWSKSGTSMRFYINGTLDAGGVKTVPAIIYNNTDPLRIGYGVDHSAGSGRDFCHCGEAGGGNNKWFAYFANGGTGNFIGHIADFRITRMARYTTNFTAPTRLFSNR